MRSIVTLSCALAVGITASCTSAPAGGEGEGEGEQVVIEPGGDLSAHIGAPNAAIGLGEEPPAGATGSCSTNQWWQLGDEESRNMHPGRACIDCHTRENEGPDLVYAGTVQMALDDANDCRGVSDVLVDIIDDATNEVVASAFTNDAGNFFIEDVVFTSPYRVILTVDGRSRQMLTAQTDGDCMKCHTVDGAEGAPGRIVAP